MKTFKFVVEQHYGEERRQAKAKSRKDAIYSIIRKDHDFLTDDNHGTEFEENRVRIVKNVKSARFALAPSWVDDGPGATWFTVYYRDLR